MAKAEGGLQRAAGSLQVLFVLGGLLSVVFGAETGKVAGRVLDRATGQPLAGANVVLVGAELGAATDVNGFYAILNVPAGGYSVEASVIGFQTVTMTDVRVEPDKSTGLDFRLVSSAIQMPSVVVRAEKPMVTKEMVAPRYTVQARDMSWLPRDYVEEMVQFSVGVVKTESTLHVRGGRAAEVDYLIDGVSIVDPLTGEFGINLSKGVADEVVFMPGGYSAEYGRSMSGVINLITVNPKRQVSADYTIKSEKPMPYYYDFGYTDHGARVHLPFGDLRTVFAGSITTTDDWDPRLYALPHKERADYSLYGKSQYDIGGKLKLALSGAVARTQFDRYKSDWRLRLDDYRSDLRRGQLGIASLTWMPSSRSYYQLTLSQFQTEKTHGVRETGAVSIWQDFRFRDTSAYVTPGMDMNNPWGCPYEYYWVFKTYGTYDDYRQSSVRTSSIKLTANNQATQSHQVSAGAVTDLHTVSTDWIRWPDWHPVVDTYRFRPASIAAYVQDRIEFEGLYADIGLRFDQFRPNATFKDTVTSRSPQAKRDTATPKSQVSPRVGASFRITEWLFARANFGYYFQVPQLSMLYDNTVNPATHRTELGDTGQLLVGNPDLKPERTQSYELGLQGEVAKGLLLTTNLWAKDVRDLVGTYTVPALPHAYITYYNEEFARLSGVELIADVRTTWLSSKLSYTLSYARGTSSYANENFFEFLRQGDSAPAVEHPLDFDQRHRIFLQLDVHPPDNATRFKPLDLVLNNTALHLLGYTGNGFPYTPPGGKGDPATWNTRLGPKRTNVDAVITKGMRFGPVKLDIVAEVLNVLDVRDVLYVYPTTGLANDDGSTVSVTDPLFYRTGQTAIRWSDAGYDPRRDHNHDGYINQYEEYQSTWLYHRATIDWVNNFGPPRRARLGFTVAF